MGGELTVRQAVGRYLGALGEQHPSTARAYRWAMTDLVDKTGDERVHEVLAGEPLRSWLESPTGAGKPPSSASVRQRATAARGLLRYTVEHRLLDAEAVHAALEALRRPATPPVTREQAPARLLLARLAGRRPHGVSRAVWIRFRAHVLLLAETGSPERELGRAHLAHLADDRTSLTLAGQRIALSESARHALSDWLLARDELVGTLQGTPPRHLWVRAHPSVHPRTGAVAAVGMPITARGLRKAFQDVVAALVDGDPRLATCTVAHVRALGTSSDVVDHDPPADTSAVGGDPS